MTDINELRQKAQQIRLLTTREIASLGVGHIGGCMSIIELLTALYYSVMKVDPQNPLMPDRDRFVLSKGHAGPALYAVLADKGYFDAAELETLNRPATRLPSHCDRIRTPGIDMTAGSLGQGFSSAVGIAIAQRLKGRDNYVYTMLGDGESQEGQVWEAAMYAAQQKLNHLIAFTDRNGLQVDGKVDGINSLSDLCAKWQAFGWHVEEIDGHDFAQILGAIERCKAVGDRPCMIVANTIKAKGVKGFENALTCHNVRLERAQWDEILDEMEQVRA